MSVRCLPADPNLEHLRNEARSLQRRYREADPQVVMLVREFDHSPPDPAAFRRSDAQRIVARLYGFASWPKLVRHIELVKPLTRNPHRVPVDGPDVGATLADRFLTLACLTYGADDPTRPARARELLAGHPELAGASIYTAAAVGDVESAERWLAADPGAAVTHGGPHSFAPLLYLTYSRVLVAAPGTSHLEVARLLLAHGADPNAGFLHEGLSPPFTALTGVFGGGEGGSNQPPHPAGLQLARLLLDAGADPNDGQTLYNRHFGLENDHLELLFAYGLGRGGDRHWHRRLPGLESPKLMLEDQLLFAAANGYAGRIELLLRHGVDPAGAGTGHPALRGKSAIELAIENGSAAIVSPLRAAGVQEPVLDPADELLASLVRGDRPAVEALLAVSPELSEQARLRDPAKLLIAVKHDRVDAVRLLVEHGFDIDARKETTALHEAAWAGNRAMVDLLLSLGADPTVRDSEHDLPPSGWAEYNGHAEVAGALQAAERGWAAR
jgi:hypothetical protein